MGGCDAMPVPRIHAWARQGRGWQSEPVHPHPAPTVQAARHTGASSALARGHAAVLWHCPRGHCLPVNLGEDEELGNLVVVTVGGGRSRHLAIMASGVGPP